jgi:trimethylamine--corrinoid protein Co-methyltransferase
MIDLEIIGRVMRIREGLDTTGKGQALESIQEIGPGGTFITHADTLAYFQDRWLPALSDWGAYENWRESGSQDVAARANRQYKEILKRAPQSLIDPEVDKALQDYIRHAT